MSIIPAEPYTRYPGSLEQTQLLLRSSWQRLQSSRHYPAEEHRRRFQHTLKIVAETRKRIERTDRLIACLREAYSHPAEGD